MDRWSRRQFVQGVGIAGLGVLAGCGRLPWQAHVESASKPARVGYLSNFPPIEGASSGTDAFREGLRELGYVEGHNILVEYRSAGGQADRLADLAAELLGLGVAAVVTNGTLATQATKRATDTVPIIMAASADPVGAGLVASLARPGGNVTGLTQISPQLSGKRLQLLTETAPSVSRVAVLWNEGQPTNAREWAEIDHAAQALGVEARSLSIHSPGDLDVAFNTASQERADGLIAVTSTLIIQSRDRIVDFAARNRWPAMFPVRDWVTSGGLMAYGANQLDLYRRAATYVDKILKGARPADLPVEQPREFDFAINLKTAQTLGLTIPQHVLLQATEVIQ